MSTDTVQEPQEATETSPEVVFSQDGNKICCMLKGRENLAEDPAGFGDTETEAKANLFQAIHADEDAKPFGAKIIVCAMIDDMPHELAVAHLRSHTPFTKEAIETFIDQDWFVDTVKKGIEDDNLEVKTMYVICNK